MKKFALSLLLLGSVLFGLEMDYNKDTISVVRHMKVAKYPDWVAKIELANGKKLFFVSPKSMMEFYHQPGKWYDIGVKSESDFKEILVTDYSTKRPIKAKGAFFIYGSNVTSPAGDDLVTFNSYAAAEEFSKKHNGKRILNFREVSPALIRLLNGRI
jgi:nitrous oxide reductase accessory protein NosL